MATSQVNAPYQHPITVQADVRDQDQYTISDFSCVKVGNICQISGVILVNTSSSNQYWVIEHLPKPPVETSCMLAPFTESLNSVGNLRVYITTDGIFRVRQGTSGYYYPFFFTYITKEN